MFLPTKVYLVMASNVEDNVEQQKPPQKLQIYSNSNSGVASFWRGFPFLHNTQDKFIWCIEFYLVLIFIVINFCAEKYEREAKKYWDVFYKRHADRVRFLNSYIKPLLKELLWLNYTHF